MPWSNRSVCPVLCRLRGTAHGCFMGAESRLVLPHLSDSQVLVARTVGDEEGLQPPQFVLVDVFA